MNDKPLLKVGIILLIIFIIYLGVRTTIGITRKVEEGYDKYSKTYKEYKEYKVAEEIVIDEEYDIAFNEVYIKATTSDISIKNSTNDKVRLKVYAKKDKASVNTDDDKLELIVKDEECIGFCFNQTKDRIELELPENYENTITLKVNYGDIDIAKYPYANITINSQAGDISLVESNQTKITNNYGDVNISKTNNINIKNDFGNIAIESANEYFDITNNFGDVTINNLNINASSKIEANYGDVSIGKTNDINIIANTNMGDAKVNKRNENSTITLIINTDLGDIRVNN